MGKLADKIRASVEAGEFDLHRHAVKQLRARMVEQWQVEAGMAAGRLVSERPHTTPSPSIEVDLELPDGTPVLSVWLWQAEIRRAMLLTVHFYTTRRRR